MSYYRRYQKPQDYKLPDKTLPVPKLSDFNGAQYYIRYKDEEHPNNDNTVFLRGIGNEKANVMFIAPSVFSEDASQISGEPGLLRSGAGLAFKRKCMDIGVDLNKEYFTTVCKYPLPLSFKNKPKSTDIKYCKPLLDEEIALVKPAIIVCLGKEAADFILNLKMSLRELEECWIYSQEYKCYVYIIDTIEKSYDNPELSEKLYLELKTLDRYYSALADDVSPKNIKQNYVKIEKEEDLKSWLSDMTAGGFKMFAVDCEWRGGTFVDGELRSVQFCWAPGKAVYLNFTDENARWMFDKPKKEIFKILADYFNNPEIKFIGHNFCADAVWLKNHIGIAYENKCYLDTMYAFQVADEYMDLKLEKLACKFTDMGRYDVDLLIWKKKNKGTAFNEIDGYGKIPTSILYPYGCGDVDATFRLASVALDRLDKDGTMQYYFNIRHPYVTESFADIMHTGIPIDSSDANRMRVAYLSCKVILEQLFHQKLLAEAKKLLFNKIKTFEYKVDKKEKYDEVIKAFNNISLSAEETSVMGKNMEASLSSFDEESDEENLKTEATASKKVSPTTTETLNKLTTIVKTNFGVKALMELLPFIEHYYRCKLCIFNHASAPDKMRWLFKVKCLTPIKTTKTNSEGAVKYWDEVEERDRSKYTWAVDKSVLQCYADEGDELAMLLLELTAVTTLTKTFLKGEDGGLQKFICSDGKLHPNLSCTESGRPRTFKPNILNIPKAVAQTTENGFRKMFKYLGLAEPENFDDISDESVEGYDEEKFNNVVNFVRKFFGIKETITIKDVLPRNIRWCFKAPKGYCFVDADYVSAEVFANAYLSNDKYLIDALTKPDYQFAMLKDPETGKEKRVRIAYIDEISLFSEDKKDLKLIHDINDPNLVRDENGELKHPKRDIYWELVESKYYMNTPREILEAEFNGHGRDVYRASGKVVNFSVAYGGGAKSITKKIELITKMKQSPDTGDRLITALEKQRPGCTAFKKKCEDLVTTQGYYQSPTGFKRHYVVPKADGFYSEHKINKIIAGLKREACNIPLQSLVADYLAVGTYKLNSSLKREGLEALVCLPFYDALYVVAKIKDRERVKQLIQECMSDTTYWDLAGGRLKLRLDFEVSKRLGNKPTKEELEEINNNEYN